MTRSRWKKYVGNDHVKNHTETFAVYVGIFTLTPFETFVGTQGHGLVPFGANLSLTWSSEVGFIYVDGMHRTQKVGEKRETPFVLSFLPSVLPPVFSFAHPTQACVCGVCVELYYVVCNMTHTNTYDLCPPLSLSLPPSPCEGITGRRGYDHSRGAAAQPLSR